jgi:hypothetical protein
MGANLTSEERDQFAVDILNETLKAIKNQDRIKLMPLMREIRARVLNSDQFDDYALSCKLDLVLNNLIRAKKIELITGFEGGLVVFGFSQLK